MKVEVPEFNKCCFCVPLRYGILIWGYLRTVIAIIMLTTTLVVTIFFIIMMNARNVVNIEYFIFPGIVMGLALVDVAFSIIFIVGGHTKNTRLMKIYYIYCIVGLVLVTVTFLAMSGLEIYGNLAIGHVEGVSPATVSLMIRSKLASGLINMIFQLYFIFLLRSEIVKLENNCKFRFVNNAADSECTLEEVNEEKVSENDESVPQINETNVNETKLNNKQKMVNITKIIGNNIGKYTKM